MAVLDIIARLQNQASPEARALTDDLVNMETAADRASVSISKHEMIQRQLDIALDRSKLASERLATAQAALSANTDPEKQARFETAVKSAEIAVKQQTLSVDRLQNELVKLDQVNDKAKVSTQSFGQQLTGTIQNIEALAAGVVAAGAVAKKAFDFAEEGAQLEFAEEKFEALTESINSNSDAMLESLDEVTRGTMTTAQQMELASQIINLGLAKEEEGVVRLANVVTNLGLDMQQVIMTFANDSKMRLDALGLSVTDVEERTKKYEAAGYAATEAFDLAVLDALEDKLQLVGSAADSDVGAFLRLRTAAAEFTDELKRNLAEGLTPWIQAAAGDYEAAANTIIDNNVSTAQSMEDLIAEGQKLEQVRDKWFGFATAITGTETAVNDGIIQVIENMAAQADSSEEFMAAMDEAFGNRTQYLINKYADSLGVSVEGIYEVVQASEDLRLANEEEIDTKQQMIQAVQAAETARIAEADAIREEAHTTGTLGVAQDELNERLAKYADYAANATARTEESTAAKDNDAEAAQKAAAAYEFLSSQVEAAQTPISDLHQAQLDLQAAQGEWVEVSRDTTGQVAELYEQLSFDLTDDQKKAMQEQLTTVTEGSEEWLSIYQGLQADLTDSQRQALVAQIADLQNAHGERLTIHTGDAEAAEEAQQRVDAAYAALAASYRAASLEISQAQIAQKFGEDALAAQLANIQMQEAMGTISADEAQGLREVAENMDLVRRTTETMMTKYLADGKLTVQESENIANAVSLIESSGIQSMDAIISMAENGRTSIDGMYDTTTTATAAIVDMKEEAQEFANTPIEPEIVVETGPAMASLNELALAAEAAAGTYEVHYNVTSDPIPDFPGGSQGGGGRDPGNTPKFGTGGYTGVGADNEIAGTVHRNEYVFDSAATRRLGVPFLESLRRGNSIREETAVSVPVATPAPATPSVIIQIIGGDLAQVQAVVRRELERVGITAQNYKRMK